MKIFLAPHNDDETLFGAFTIQKEHPVVIVVYDSYAQVNRGALWCDAASRRAESIAALRILLGPCADVRFGALRDDEVYTVDVVASRIASQLRSDERCEGVFAPGDEDGGHPQHNLVAAAALTLVLQWKVPLIRYSTYTTQGGRTRTAQVVPMTPIGIMSKLRALACYESQIIIETCRQFFTQDLSEYYL